MRQKASAGLWAGILAVSALLACLPVSAQPLSPGSASFREFGTPDNGASFSRGLDVGGGSSQSQASARIVGVDRQTESVRVRFNPIGIELTLPMGWQAVEDWERGAAYSADKRYRVFVWRVDFAFEGVKDAEHYAATKAGSIKARRPGVQAQARKLADGSMLILYENVPKGPGDSGPRTVADLVIPNPKDPKLGVLLTLGMPGNDSKRAIDFLALLRQNMRIDW